MARGMSFSEALAAWRNFRSSAWSSTETARSYDLQIRWFLGGLPGSTPLCDIGPTDIQRIYLFIQRGRAGASTNKAHDTLHAFFGWAIGLGVYVGKNPVNRSSWPTLDAEAKRSAKSRTHNFVSPERIGELVELLPFWARRQVLSLYLIGWRVSAMLASDYIWIIPDQRDPSQRVLRIPKECQKTRRDLYIPLGNRALSVLGSGTGLIFPERKTAKSLRDALARAGEKLGYQRLHPHDFRGSCASGLLAAGMPLNEVAELLGWRQPPQEIFRLLRDHYWLQSGGDRARRMSDQLLPES